MALNIGPTIVRLVLASIELDYRLSLIAITAIILYVAARAPVFFAPYRRFAPHMGEAEGSGF